MRKIMKTLTQPFRKFWLSEFELSGKKFYYGTVFASLLILVVFSFAIYYFSVWGVVVLFVKQTLRLVFVAVTKLTLKAMLLIGVKKGFIDGVVMPRLKKNVFPYIIPAIIARLKDSRSKLLRWIGMTFAGLSAIALAIFAFLSNGWVLLQSVFVFLGGKIVAALGFKTFLALITSLWALLVKYWAVIKTTPPGILIQVYVVSKIMDLLVKLIPKRARRRLRPIKDWFIDKFWGFQSFIDKLFGWHLEERMKKIARWIEPPAERKKRNHERLLLALERKKQQKQNHPQNDAARISGFDARRAGKHRPDRNQQNR